MSLEVLDATLKQLIAEYESSGMNIDEFIVQKLKDSGRTDASQVVQDINATLRDIDAKYDSLQQFKQNGGNREEWLRQEMDSATQNIASDKAGQILSSAIKVLNGDDSDIPDEQANYDAIDAALMVKNLDDAIVKNTCVSLKEEVK